MNSFRVDKTLVFDTCHHIKSYTSDNGFKPVDAHESDASRLDLGVDEEGNTHVMFLCRACGERLERNAIIGFLSNLKLNVKIHNNSIELNSPNIWKRFLELLKVESL